MLTGCALLAASLPHRAAAAERATSPGDAVVFVRVIGTLTTDDNLGWRRSDSREGVELGTGSGFSVTSRGHVLTNLHVVRDQSFQFDRGGTTYSVTLERRRIEIASPGSGSRESRSYAARVVATDEALDLALLEVDGPPVPYLAPGDSESAGTGAGVRALGFPFGRRVAVGRAWAPSIVPQLSATSGSIVARRPDEEDRTRYLQTDAIVNPGSSGGPIVDEHGRGIGIVRMRLADTGAAFAIPIDLAKDFLEVSGYAQFLPSRRLQLGRQDELPHKSVSLRFLVGARDGAEARSRIDARDSLSSVRLEAERVPTPWSAARVLRSLETGEHEDSTPWRVLGLVGEAILARYLGAPDELAFNSAAIAASLESLTATPLADSPIAGPVPVAALEGFPLGTLATPGVLLPIGWFVGSPVRGTSSCGVQAERAVAASPPGDFTVSLRAYWHAGSDVDAEAAARTCSRSRSGLGRGSYVRSEERFGVRFGAEGLFVPLGGGLLQLEVSAPEEKLGFLAALAGAWVSENLEEHRPGGAAGTAGVSIRP